MEIDKKIIKVSASSYQDWEFHFSNVLEDDTEFFCSYHQKNSWIQLKLKNKRAKLLAYKLESARINNYFLKSWVLLASNDKGLWTCLDEHNNDSTMSGKSITHIFNTNSNSYYKYFRLVSTQLNSDCLCIAAFRLIGELVD